MLQMRKQRLRKTNMPTTHSYQEATLWLKLGVAQLSMLLHTTNLPGLARAPFISVGLRAPQ